ncbi:unnamed protein product, partial [Mesorhabditis spiculigera]
MIVFGLFLAIYHIFMTLLFVSYYHYIRDRQLELEQQQGRMQSALITLIHSALFIYICIYETKGTGGYFPDRKGHLKQGYPWPVTIAFGILLLIYHVFMTLLFISYYHFIRDRQLEQEQQQGRMQSIQTYR